MARGRMFSIDECRADAFLHLDVQTREFYIQLCLDADDDGFVSNPLAVSRILGYNENEKDTMVSNLEQNNLIFIFKNENILVIRHWRVHNRLSPSKHCDTRYIDLVNKLEMDSSQTYHLKKSVDQIDPGYKPVPIYQNHKMMTIGIGGEIIEVTGGDTDADTDAASDVTIGADSDGSQTLSKTEKNKLYKQFKKIYPSGKRLTDNYNEIELQREFFARINSKDDYDTLAAYIDIKKNSDDWKESDGAFIPNPLSFIISNDWKRPPSQT